VSDALEILSSGGLIRLDGLLLSLDHRLWPWARAVSCFVGLCKTEALGKVYNIFIISSAVSALGIKTGDLASMHR
jgi:hypothetical protein